MKKQQSIGSQNGFKMSNFKLLEELRIWWGLLALPRMGTREGTDDPHVLRAHFGAGARR